MTYLGQVQAELVVGQGPHGPKGGPVKEGNRVESVEDSVQLVGDKLPHMNGNVIDGEWRQREEGGQRALGEHAAFKLARGLGGSMVKGLAQLTMDLKGNNEVTTS